MELFTYNETTLEYQGVEKQHLDPLESIKAKNDIYIKITNGTTKKPLKHKEGYTQIFKADKWVYKKLPKQPEPKKQPEPTKEEIEEQKSEQEYQAWLNKKNRAEFKKQKGN